MLSLRPMTDLTVFPLSQQFVPAFGLTVYTILDLQPTIAVVFVDAELRFATMPSKSREQISSKKRLPHPSTC